MKNFTNAQDAFVTLHRVELLLPLLLSDKNIWASYKIIHDEPEVWRLWTQLGDIRICFHKIYSCLNPFMHPHPWPSVVKCLAGGYQHNIGIYNGQVDDVATLCPDELDEFSSYLTTQTSQVVAGSVYEMTDIRVFHSVKASDVNWSLMIMGIPYFPGITKQFSRKTPISIPLDEKEHSELFDFAKNSYKI